MIRRLLCVAAVLVLASCGGPESLYERAETTNPPAYKVYQSTELGPQYVQVAVISHSRDKEALGAMAFELAHAEGVDKVIVPVYSSERQARADRAVSAVVQLDTAKERLSVDF